MPRPNRPKKPPIGENPIETNEFLFWQNSETPKEITDDSFLLSSSFLSPSSPSKRGKKREHPQSPTEKENRTPTKKTTKPMPITASMPSIPFPPLSPEQHLQKALESLIQAYKGLKEEEKKEQVKQLEDYIRSILVGENPFIKEKQKKEKDILKGLVEEVRALCKEVAPIKETYAERLKKDLSSSPFSRVTSNIPSSTSTRNKKKTTTRKEDSPNYGPKGPTSRSLLYTKSS